MLGEILAPILKNKLANEVVDRIRTAIKEGGLEPGAKLPSERDLAEQLGVSRMCIREALSVLSATGLVVVRPGVGTFVAADALSSGSASGQWCILGRNSPAEVLELRQMLEPPAAALAAERATAKDLARLDQILHEMAEVAVKAGPLSEESVKLEVRFHVSVASAARNTVLVRLLFDLHNTFMRSVFEYRKRTFAVDPGRYESILDEHKAIFQAIHSRDPMAAHGAMVQHLANTKALLSKGGMSV